jgi:hypothetical protein
VYTSVRTGRSTGEPAVDLEDCFNIELIRGWSWLLRGTTEDASVEDGKSDRTDDIEPERSRVRERSAWESGDGGVDSVSLSLPAAPVLRALAAEECAAVVTAEASPERG